MTIICARNGVVAADSGAFDGHGNILSRDTQKLAVVLNGAYKGGILTATGPTWWCEEFLDWSFTADSRKEPAPSTDDPDSSACGSIFLPVDDYESLGGAMGMMRHYIFEGPKKRPFKRDAFFFASGYSFSFALGAMTFGASAIEAVETCIRDTTYAEGPVQSISMLEARDIANR